jgi:hypothetical protein
VYEFVDRFQFGVVGKLFFDQVFYGFYVVVSGGFNFLYAPSVVFAEIVNKALASSEKGPTSTMPG